MSTRGQEHLDASREEEKSVFVHSVGTAAPTSLFSPQTTDRRSNKYRDSRPLQPTLPARLSCESHFYSRGYTCGTSAMFRLPSWCRRLDVPTEEQTILKSPSPELTTLAFASLQLLPVPVMVLSSQKVVVFANEAMSALLDINPEGVLSQGLEGWSPRSVMAMLQGKSLFEVGIAILDERSPEWEDQGWDTMLDGLIQEMSNPYRYSSNSDSEEKKTFPWRLSLDPRGATVDVVFRPHKAESHNDTTSKSRIQISAQMSVTAWVMDSDTYFTLTFTSVTHTIKTPSRAASPADPILSSPAETHTTLSCDWRNELSESGAKNGGCSSLRVAPLVIAPARSIVQHKLAKLKDAIIDLMDLPVLILGVDGSLVFPNRAGLDLLKSLSKSCLPVDHTLDIINCFTPYKEDFSRPLSLEEHPVVRVCKNRENFNNLKVGLFDILGNKKVHDTCGKGIYDEETGEFYAGVIWSRDITEFQEKLDAQKAADELRFMTICNVMPQLIWTSSPSGYVDWWSERWYDFTGLSLPESLGLAWEQSIHPQDLEETLKKWKASLSSGEAYGIEYRVKRCDGQYRWMLGRGLPLRDPATNQILKWFGTCTDIDELVEARLDTKRTREQLTNVMAHAALTVWTIDRDFKVCMIDGDQVWAKNAGTPQSSFIGESIYSIISKEENPNFYAPLEGILNGTITGEDNAEYNMNGRCLRTTFVPIKGQDCHGNRDETVVTGVIGVCVDITDKVKALHELAEREKENQILMTNERAANEACKLKSIFLASMSHEIRTPIAGVLGMADLLLDTKLSTDQFEFVESIQSCANALLTVINDILDFSKVESGKMELEHVQFNLFHIIGDVTRMLAFEAEKKKLSFEYDIQLMCHGKFCVEIYQGANCSAHTTGNQCCVMGDPGRLRQVLTNLISNSIKFTHKGSVRLLLSAEDEDADSVTVKFVVEDTGIGIDEKKQARLFHPFTQADSSTARRFGGTGLGLSISKNLVELMGGSIGLSSKVGQGTTAWFTIPFNKPGRTTSSRSGSVSSDAGTAEGLTAYLREFERLHQNRPPLLRNTNNSYTFPLSQDECQLHVSHTLVSDNCQLHLAPTLPEPSISTLDREKLHVLVVEDNEVNQQIALRVIQKLGFSVSAVSTGAEAIRFLHSSCKAVKGGVLKPDIILMDVHMPEMDGYQATQIIRSGDLSSAGLGLNNEMSKDIRERLKGLPIIAMTASAIRGDSDKCLAAGMDDYLSKPVKRQDLERMLIKWLASSGCLGTIAEPVGDVSSHTNGLGKTGSGECCNDAGSCVLSSEKCNAWRNDCKGKPRRQRPTKIKRAISTPVVGKAITDPFPYYPHNDTLPEESSEDGHQQNAVMRSEIADGQKTRTPSVKPPVASPQRPRSSKATSKLAISRRIPE